MELRLTTKSARERERERERGGGGERTWGTKSGDVVDGR